MPKEILDNKILSSTETENKTEKEPNEKEITERTEKVMEDIDEGLETAIESGEKMKESFSDIPEVTSIVDQTDKETSNTADESKKNILSRLRNSSLGHKIIKGATAATFLLGIGNMTHAENNEKNNGKLKLMSEMSSYYENEADKKENSLQYVDKDMTPEETANLKKEIDTEISNDKEVANNPEKFYEELIARTEAIRGELKTHFASPEFLAKLEMNLSPEEATKKQTELVENLTSSRLVIASPDSIKSRTSSKSAGASYSSAEHRVLIPFANLDDEMIAHELIHSAYRASEALSPEETKTLDKLFKKDPQRSEKENAYQKKSAERIVRKKLLDLELERNGIKNYQDKFTHEHYQKLLELKKQNQLGAAANDILETISEKQLEELMNTIAFNDSSEKGGTYQHAGWEYNDKNNLA